MAMILFPLFERGEVQGPKRREPPSTTLFGCTEGYVRMFDETVG